ncbi:type II toxin-antitoxin system VapC family toxin [Microbacterium sp.]|uniref:type II toxin-antitoxin system VapC family toxin n=1 Tax=Microbacterium sp. TaxID=51671 RepID=UPI003C73AD14
MTTNADAIGPVVVDTTVLLAATDMSRSAHVAATAFLSDDERPLALTPQIVREYLAVATRPETANGLGLTAAQARANVDEFLSDMRLLADDATAVRRLLELVSQGAATGKQVHDANIVAVAVAHRAVTIVTDNLQHFTRYSDLISIEALQH